MTQILQATLKLAAVAAIVAGAALAVHNAAAAVEVSDAAKKVLAFDEKGGKLEKKYRVAYVTECVQNAYCQARLKGLQDAAAKYGFEFKVFDANFNPATQLKDVQNAVIEGFDGYLFAPTAAAPACNMWRTQLQPTGKPVVTLDLPMCGDQDYTQGLAGTVTMQRQGYYDEMVYNAFDSCGGKPCKAAALGGFVGSDLYGFWAQAIKNGEAKYPNVTVVSEQPANYDPRIALQKTQDILLQHPDLNLVLSAWDDTTRGIQQAIEQAGKKPGQDVRIYSIGANGDGVQRVKDGAWNGVAVLLPWEESYYAAVALAMALEGQPVNAYVDERMLPRVSQSVGTIFITKDNAAKYTPNY